MNPECGFKQLGHGNAYDRTGEHGGCQRMASDSYFQPDNRHLFDCGGGKEKQEADGKSVRSEYKINKR